jgi:hypothetical protein
MYVKCITLVWKDYYFVVPCHAPHFWERCKHLVGGFARFPFQPPQGIIFLSPGKSRHRFVTKALKQVNTTEMRQNSVILGDCKDINLTLTSTSCVQYPYYNKWWEEAMILALDSKEQQTMWVVTLLALKQLQILTVSIQLPAETTSPLDWSTLTEDNSVFVEWNDQSICTWTKALFSYFSCRIQIYGAADLLAHCWALGLYWCFVIGDQHRLYSFW